MPFAFVRGLSPATRGTPFDPPGRQARKRFIPGYAGNAGEPTIKDARTTVYPRLRGERWEGLITCRAPGGLSPATRGTLDLILQRPRDVRFIPGYAGNAHCLSLIREFVTVYPRLRGERMIDTPAANGLTGLSPATRGTQRDGLARNRFPRFIPGYAGNANRRGRQSKRNAVYPRLRGERSKCTWLILKRKFMPSKSTKKLMLLKNVSALHSYVF